MYYKSAHVRLSICMSEADAQVNRVDIFGKVLDLFKLFTKMGSAS